MVKSAFSTAWKSSTQPRKQRKYVFNAPLHLRQKFVHSHLSPELRTKYGTRNTQLKVGDKVKVLRGQFKNKEGKVERVDLKDGKMFVTGVDYAKKNGSKVMFGLRPSNVMIIELQLADKKRKAKLEGNKKQPVSKVDSKKIQKTTPNKNEGNSK